jgi:hypothetical protein
MVPKNELSPVKEAVTILRAADYHAKAKHNFNTKKKHTHKHPYMISLFQEYTDNKV